MKNTMNTKSKCEKELDNLIEVLKRDLHSALTDDYVGQVVEIFADYHMTVDQARDYDNYPELLKACIEIGVCTMDMWKAINDKYDTAFEVIYNCLKEENTI